MATDSLLGILRRSLRQRGWSADRKSTFCFVSGFNDGCKVSLVSLAELLGAGDSNPNGVLQIPSLSATWSAMRVTRSPSGLSVRHAAIAVASDAGARMRRDDFPIGSSRTQVRVSSPQAQITWGRAAQSGDRT